MGRAKRKKDSSLPDLLWSPAGFVGLCLLGHTNPVFRRPQHLAKSSAVTILKVFIFERGALHFQLAPANYMNGPVKTTESHRDPVLIKTVLWGLLCILCIVPSGKGAP